MSSLQTQPPPCNNADRIVTDLRGKIVQGLLVPGAKLPTHQELTQQYTVARATLMRAMNHLKQDGFVQARSTRGTYVCEHPPHLSRFGLVFATDPQRFGGLEWNHFWSVLASRAPVIGRSERRKCPLFYAVADPQSEGHAALKRDLASERLGGLIVVGREDVLEEPLLRKAEVPKVAIHDGELPGTPRLYVDRPSFLDRALDELKARGAQRVALLTSHLAAWPGFTAAAQAKGLETRPSWQQAGWGDAVSPLMQLLFCPDHPRVPDGLVIADDNLVGAAIGGLMQSGIRVPEQLKLVAHCNWPAPLPSSLPAVRLGYDVDELLHRCVDTLVRLRRGESVEAVQHLPARLGPKPETALTQNPL